MLRPDAFVLSSPDLESDPFVKQHILVNASTPQHSSRQSAHKQVPYSANADDSHDSQDEQDSENDSESNGEEQEVTDSDDKIASISNSNPSATRQEKDARFAELSRMFATAVEENRKLRLVNRQMSRHSARHSLDFKSPKSKRARELVDSYVEKDSLRLYSSRSVRKICQENFRAKGEQVTDSPSSHAVKQWIRKHALQGVNWQVRLDF